MVHTAPPVARRAIRTGASDCLLKTDSVPRLQEAFRKVLAEPPAPLPYGQARLPGRARTDQARALGRLTKRELEVLPYITRGFTVAETSELMKLCPKTVETHKTNLMAKLGIHDRVTLARFAIREGLIPIWED